MPIENQPSVKKSTLTHLIPYIWMLIGAFISAFAIEVFFLPNNLIDGGTVGLAMICGRLFGNNLIPFFLLILNLPFIVLAYRHVGKVFVAHVVFAVISFSICLAILPHLFPTPFIGDNLEVVVIGGAILGVGIGLIIRGGGCVDGTEILGIITNRKQGFTVGQVVLVCNIFVFSTAGFVFQDWHPPILSLIAYVVVVKIMDAVIVGLDESKSVLVISSKPQEITQAILKELGLGVTVLYGRGGFSGTSLEVLYVVTERLHLSELKELIYGIDPRAFMAIENLHEVSAGKHGGVTFFGKKKVSAIAQKALHI